MWSRRRARHVNTVMLLMIMLFSTACDVFEMEIEPDLPTPTAIQPTGAPAYGLTPLGPSEPPVPLTAAPTNTPRPQLTASASPMPVQAVEPTHTPLPPLQILSFTASPDPVERGGLLTLSWNAPGAARVGITRLSEEGDIFLATEALDLPARGSISLRVPQEYIKSVKYVLGARDADGTLHHAYVTAGVLCPYNEHFAPRCPLTQDSVWAAYEPFERGHMVWRSDTREIYILYDDGSYKAYEDTWQEGDPVDIPGTPPPGLLAPVRGFGNLYANQPHLQEKLGWATAEEVGYMMAVETIPGGSGRYPGVSIFFTLPDGPVISLYPFSSTWQRFP